MTSIFICFYVKTLENLKFFWVIHMHMLPALKQLWEAKYAFPVNALNNLVLCCGFLFCFLWSMICLVDTLKVVMYGEILARYLKSWLYIHLLLSNSVLRHSPTVHTLRKLAGVSEHVCGRADERQFSVWCLCCGNRSRRLSHLWMNWN